LYNVLVFYSHIYFYSQLSPPQTKPVPQHEKYTAINIVDCPLINSIECPFLI